MDQLKVGSEMLLSHRGLITCSLVSLVIPPALVTSTLQIETVLFSETSEASSIYMWGPNNLAALTFEFSKFYSVLINSYEELRLN